MGTLMFHSRVFDLIHQKHDLEYKFVKITRKLSDLRKFSAFVGTGEMSIGAMLGVPGTMLGRTLNYMGYSQQMGAQFMQQYGPYYQQMAQQQANGQPVDPQTAQMQNEYIMQQLYWAGRDKAKRMAEYMLKEEEEKITAEKESCELQIKEVENELKAAKEARDKGIQDLMPKYSA